MAERLFPPPQLADNTLRVIPLGGHGDVGRNMSCFEFQDRILLIDCGVLFPKDMQPGVDQILPALNYLKDRLEDIDGLLLTHGHEDHIGAVPYLLQMRQDIPIYGTQLTLELLGNKFKEHRISNPVLHPICDGEQIQIGNFECQFLAVNHSIPDAVAIFLKTPAGTVFHTGDFKLDQFPLDGRITDLRGFAKAGEAGVDLLMVDSTNAEIPGFITSERSIEPALETVFAQAKQKIVVASFASHIHRVQQVLDLAVKHGRKVAYVGRSMLRNMTVARELGYLHVTENTVIDLKDVDKFAPHEIVVICTGSQGEPLAALSRMAQQEHSSVKIFPGDTVLLASSLVPGNENAVSRVINGLSKLGATVVHKGNALVHVSGHAPAGELALIYNIIQPKNAMPVHGEMRHMQANKSIAIAAGVPQNHVVVAEDGYVVDLCQGDIKVTGTIDASYIFVEGTSVGELDEDDLSDRRTLGEEGFISIVAVVSTHNQAIISGPDIHARGFADDDSAFDAIRPAIVETLEAGLEANITDSYVLQQRVRRVIGRWVNQTYRRHPMIVPVVVVM